VDQAVAFPAGVIALEEDKYHLIARVPLGYQFQRIVSVFLEGYARRGLLRAVGWQA